MLGNCWGFISGQFIRPNKSTKFEKFSSFDVFHVFGANIQFEVVEA